MTAGTKSDFTIYNAQFFGGMFEKIDQMLSVFNGASRNSVQLVQAQKLGEFAKEQFFKSVTGGLISRRDVTSVAAVESKKLSTDEIISVKINRKIGPAEHTLDSFRKVAKDPMEFSYVIGQMVGEEKVKDLLNTGILALAAALGGQTSVVYDATGQTTKTLQTLHLVNGLSRFGDASGKIIAWTMHSKNYFDLVKDQISDKMVNVADAIVYGGTPATLGRPVIVTDCPGLVTEGTVDAYGVLGLTEGAVVVSESEQQEIETQKKLGGENITMIIQGEYAFNVELKGFKWDVSNGGANPTNAALGTATNWDKVMSSYKDLGGIFVKVQ